MNGTGTPAAGAPSGAAAPKSGGSASGGAPAASGAQGQPGAPGGQGSAVPAVPRPTQGAQGGGAPPAQGGADPGASRVDRGDGRDAQGRWVGAGPDPAGNSPAEQPAAAPTPQPRPRLKVNGKDVEAPAYVSELLANPNLTPEVRNALLADLQRGMAADELFRGASERTGAMDALLKGLKGPDKVKAFRDLLGHKEIGLDALSVAQEILAREFQREQLTPEQRELEDLKSERDRFRAEAEQRNIEAQQIRQQQQQREIQAQVQRDIISALDNPKTNQGLPRTAEVARRINQYLIQDARYRAKLDPRDPNRSVALSPADVMPLVKQDYQGDLQTFISGMDAPAILAFLGEDIAKKIREHDLAQFKNGGPRIEQPTQIRPRVPQPAANQTGGLPQGRETYEQVRERILARFR